METKTPSPKLSVIYHCLTLSCFIFNLFLTVYLFLDLKTLHRSHNELQQRVADNTLKIQECAEHNALNPGITKTAEPLSRQGRQLTSHNLITDLIHAQEQILQTHCANDSRLCMQGPKGETGLKGDTGSPGFSKDPNGACACLFSPSIHSDNATQHLLLDRPTVLDCSATGNPDPFITWYKEGVRINNNPNITVTTPGNYTCTAENIVGVATSSFHVT